jgi:hypothetical protein
MVNEHRGPIRDSTQSRARPRAATRGPQRTHAFPAPRHVGLGTSHGYRWREHVTAAELPPGVELRALG